MRPVPFPEPYRTILDMAGGVFAQWGAPLGHDDEVAPTEACTYYAGVVGVDGEVSRPDQQVTSVIIELTDEDLEVIASSRMFEFGVWGNQLPVFFFHPLRTVDADEMGQGSREGQGGV